MAAASTIGTIISRPEPDRGRFEGGLFLSDVRGDGYFGYSAFDTQTANLLLSYKLTSRDTITLKGINNELYTELPFRMSLDQFKENPFQKGCATAVNAALGCATNNFSATNTAPFVSQTAEQAGANRDDRRTIGGVRWEHEFDADTIGRVQYVIDDRNINQPTGTTSGCRSTARPTMSPREATPSSASSSRPRRARQRTARAHQELGAPPQCHHDGRDRCREVVDRWCAAQLHL